MINGDVEVYANTKELTAAAAKFFADIVLLTFELRGVVNIALSGGKSPAAMHEYLAKHYKDLPWDKVRIFMGDERLVPFDDPDSNFGMARRTFIDAVGIPESNLFPMPTVGQSPDKLAEMYAQQLGNELELNEAGFPILDLIYLGLGDDGHTASLFPGKHAIHEKKRWCVATPHGVLPPPVDRITLTLPVLNAGRQVLFLASGKAKAEILGTVLKRGYQSESHPASMVAPRDGELFWLVDREAIIS